MTPEEFRQAFEKFRDEVDTAATRSKSSQDAYAELSSLYSRLDPAERQRANAVLSDWVLSDDESRRWDAQALIADYSIVSSLPALRRLQNRLKASNAPSAPYEWAKVNRIVAQLTGGGDDQ